MKAAVQQKCNYCCLLCDCVTCVAVPGAACGVLSRQEKEIDYVMPRVNDTALYPETSTLRQELCAALKVCIYFVVEKHNGTSPNRVYHWNHDTARKDPARATAVASTAHTLCKGDLDSWMCFLSSLV